MDGERKRRAGKLLGIGGSIYGVVFMVAWCAIAGAMDAWFMLIFGVPMLIFMIVRLGVMLSKAKETPKEPWEQPPEPDCYERGRCKTAGFCPYCSFHTEEDFDYCPKCGRRLK